MTDDPIHRRQQLIEVAISHGDAWLTTTSGARTRSSSGCGSLYTPRVLTEPIVAEAFRPWLEL